MGEVVAESHHLTLGREGGGEGANAPEDYIIIIVHHLFANMYLHWLKF